jgi:hypothetical protein
MKFGMNIMALRGHPSSDLIFYNGNIVQMHKNGVVYAVLKLRILLDQKYVFFYKGSFEHLAN